MSSEHVAGSQEKRITGHAQATRIERREWVLWFLALLVTLLLTVAVVSFALPAFNPPWDSFYWFHIGQSIHGLIAMVLLFDVYAIYQQLQIQRIRRQLNERDELFRVITENAADMIAVVETDGKRIYNSPAYERVLGYSLEELGRTSAFEQIHPDDRQQVIDAADRARRGGIGECLEYRMRHKNGSWKILESTASVIRAGDGNAAKLVVVNRDITDRKEAEAKLRHSALYDSLTNLPNRGLFLDRLAQAVVRGKRHSEHKLAVLFIDIDDFKKFNDSLGHSQGDQLLIAIGQRLTMALRDGDTVSHES